MKLVLKMHSPNCFQCPLCKKCVTGVDNPENKSKAVDYYNARLLKMADVNALTDSDTNSLIDPHFSIPNDSSTEVSSNSNDGSKANSCPTVSRSKTGKDGYVFNPFIGDSSNEQLTEVFNPKMSSTFHSEVFNPKMSSRFQSEN